MARHVSAWIGPNGPVVPRGAPNLYDLFGESPVPVRRRPRRTKTRLRGGWPPAPGAAIPGASRPIGIGAIRELNDLDPRRPSDADRFSTIRTGRQARTSGGKDMRMMRLLAGVALASILGVGAAGAQTVLRSSDTHPDGYPTVEGVKYFGELVKERTGGRYEVEVYHSAQLGEEKDTIEQVRSGVIQLNRVSMAPFNGTVKETIVPALPYVFRDEEHMHKVMDGPVGDQIKAAFEPAGLVALAFYDAGSRSFYNSKKPISTVADMAGMKFRVIQSDIFVDMTAALGANATPMPYGEVYSSIETGVIDGAENNFPSYDTARHVEVAKYYSLDQHTILPEVFVMNKAAFDALTPEDQEIFRQAAKDSVGRQRELWTAMTENSRKKAEEAGAEINEVEKQGFIDAMKPVYDKHVNDDVLRKLVEDVRATQ
jgi:tripartite ATP-independent transporter DctP family solute receptor